MPPPLRTERRHDLDWLRFIAILILLFFHTGMLFNPWPWHVKNVETGESFRYWMVWLHGWRMPLLLFISGAGTYIALGKRTPAQFAGERITRLLVPLIFGIFVVVPPQIYFERINNYDGYLDFYKSVLAFVPYPQGSLSWHHLWFVAYLLVYSLVAIPFLIFLRSETSQRFGQKVARVLTNPSGLLFIPALALLLSQAILRPYFPDETHALIGDWAYFTYYFLFFIAGMLCYSQAGLWTSIGTNRKRLLTACLLTLIPFYALYFHFRQIIKFPLDNATAEVLFDITSIFLSWFTVVTVIGYGQRFLNKPHAWLKPVNEGLYPFYILHQTLIIALGFYICQLPWSVFAKFWSVSLLTLMGCLAIYFFLIRPFSITRFLFGMKVKKAERKPHETQVEKVTR